MTTENNNIQPLSDTNDLQIVLYQPDESIRLEVKLEQDTVWLNRQQIAQLFGRQVLRQVEYYNLDVILSVGYRVVSVNKRCKKKRD